MSMADDIIVGVKQEDIKTWTVTRDVLDPRLGELGLVRMKVYAFTGPEALVAADIKREEISLSFLRNLNENNLRFWNSDGWHDRKAMLERLEYTKKTTPKSQRTVDITIIADTSKFTEALNALTRIDYNTQGV